MKLHRDNSILLQLQLILGHMNSHLRPNSHQILFTCEPYIRNFYAS